MSAQARRTRKRKKSPSNLRRDAKRLTDFTTAQILAVSAEREEAWREGGHPNVVERTTVDLASLYERLRAARRALYDAGFPEGDEFVRALDKAMADVLAVPRSRSRKGEMPNTVLATSKTGSA